MTLSRDNTMGQMNFVYQWFFLPMRENAQLQYSDWETFSSNKQCQPQLRTDSRWAELSYVAIQTIKQQTLQKLQKRWLQSHMVAQKQANCTLIWVRDWLFDQRSRLHVLLQTKFA